MTQREILRAPSAEKIPDRDRHLLSEANGLIDWIHTCRRNDGLLCGWIDPSKGTRDADHLLQDFGDWSPFFIYFGRTELAKEHIARIPEYLSADGILRAQQRRGPFSIVTAFEHTDLLLGLFDCASLGIRESLDLGESLLQSCTETFHIGKGLNSYYIPSLRMSVPITSSVDATFIELFVQAHQLAGKESYIRAANTLAEYFISLPFVHSHGLFPELSGFAFGSRTRSAQTMKHNTNAASAILELLLHSPSERLRAAIDAWVDATSVLLLDGLAYFSVERVNASWKGSHVDIVPSVGLLDALCDITFALQHGRARTTALKIGTALLALQQTTGLVQRSPDNVRTHFDAQTDLIIAWEKLARISNDKRFSLAARRLFDAVRQHHKFEGGYVLSCDSTTGKIVDFMQNTRYNALFLKPYILYTHAKDAYDDPFITQLLKDR